MPISFEKAAYLAGLFDGEGTFSIQVSVRSYKGRPSVHPNPRMSMSLKYGNEVLDELVNAFGGRCYEYPKTEMRKWCMSRREDLLVASHTLLPFLRVKRRVCERFIEALEIMPSSRKAHGKGERSWTSEMVVRVAEIAFTLNPSGKRSPKVRAAAAHIDQLRAAYA